MTEKARRSDALYFDNSKMPRRTLCDMVAQLEEDKKELQTENTELRGLLRDVWWHMVSASWHEDSPNPSAFIDRMRELRVKVD